MKRAFATLLLAAALVAGCARDFDPVTGVAEARSLLEKGQTGEARILLKNLLSRHPQTASARVLLAQIALDEGDAQAASDEISTLKDVALEDVEAQKVFARVEIETGRPEDALKRVQASGELIPQPDRALLLSSVYLALETPADALAVLREVQAAIGSSEPLVLGIAETLAVMGNFELAEAELTRYLAGNPPERANALRMRGEAKLRQGKPDEAIVDFRSAVEAAPAHWSSINRITTELLVADALIAAGRIDAAKKQLEKVEKTSPGTLGAMILQGQLALLEGRPDEAAERLESANAAGGGNPRIRYLLVEALLKAGNVARASELLEQLVASEPKSSPSRRVLAAMYMQLGRPDKVIEILGDVAEIGVSDGGNDDGDLLAAARLARENAAQAISTLSGKLAASPADAGLRAELAAAQLANGEPAVALKTLGALADGKQSALAIATRLSAHYVTGNDFEANRVVDLLLNPKSGADLPMLMAAVDASAKWQQYASASRLLQRAVTLAPASPEVQIRRASLAFAERKYDDAKSILNEMLRLEPGNHGAQLALARVSEAQGDVAGSRSALEAAVMAQPSAIEPALMLASLELRASNVEAASKALNGLVEKNKDASAPNAAGVVMARAGRYEEARTRFRQAIDRQPENAEYWFNLGEAQLAQKDPVAARDSFLRSAALRPDSLPAGFAAVRLSIEQKDVRSAQQVAEKLVAKLPDSPTSWLLLGEAHAAGGDVSVAAAHFARSYAVRPSALAATREFAARVAAGMQRPEEPLLKWLAREAADTDTRLLLSDFYLVRGLEEQARDQLEIIVKQKPNDVAALNNLAWVVRSSAPARAESLARRARNIAPDNLPVADTLGVILLGNGKTDEALATLQLAAAGMPNDPNVQYHYAMSLSKAGQNEKARDVLNQALQSKRDFAEREAARKLFKELG